MIVLDIEKKYNSRAYRIFEWLFMLIITNIFTILLICPIITSLPAITAMYATIKESITDGPYQPLKSYFKNFLKYSERSFLVELVLGGIIAVAVIGVWYYNGKIGSDQILSNVGFWVMIFFILIAILLLLHMPQLIITFKNLKTKELIKTAFYITFRYLGVTGVAIVLFLISIFGLVAAPIWFLIGLSGPALLIIKFSEPLFYRLNKIDFERIMRQIDEEEENENE